MIVHTLYSSWPAALRAVVALLVIAPGTAAAQLQVPVSSPSELAAAVRDANAAGGNRRIELADGTYDLADTLYVTAPAITIRGRSGDRSRVIIRGDAMSSTARVKSLIRVSASDFQLSALTLSRAGWHLLQIAGESDADRVAVRNVVFQDSYQQMLKVTVDPARPSVTSDDGTVEDSVFEYTAGRGPQYYIGGIDAHGAKNWTVRRNTFRDIASPSGGVAEFAIHFWNGSANNMVEQNQIFDCDRGIGFGLDGRPNSGGVIRNNFVFHSGANDPFADVGIALVESPGSKVLHNTVVLRHALPWAIEYRFASTRDVVIANNLSNKPVLARDGATGSTSGNVTNAALSWFVSANTGDLHLAQRISSVVDAAAPTSPVTAFDIDGQSRPSGSAADVGADEMSALAPPAAPSNVRVD